MGDVTNMAYLKQDIIKKIELNSAPLYKHDEVNYKGISDEKELYNEIIAEYILKNPDILNTKSYIRDKTYNVDRNKYKRPESNKRKEENIAITLWEKAQQNHTFENSIGKILNFQVPLKTSQKDTGLGKIDIVSYNKSENALYLLELKIPKSTETILRCILEIDNYYRAIGDKNKFINDFKKNSADLKKGILIFEDSNQYKEWLDIGNHPLLKQIIKMLEINIFVIDEDLEKCQKLN